MSGEIVEIDGSLLEGGGQILRMSLIISVLSRTPIRVYNIRAGRSKPGLMDQHLKGVQLVGKICNAKVSGAELGSTQITFLPGHLKGGHYEARIQTAGSISLLMQVAIPCLLFADSNSSLKLYGGTNADMAPQIEYITEVFRPLMEKFGATFDFQLNRRGYFPRGGGEVDVNIQPVLKLNPVTMTERGQLTHIFGWSFVAGVLPLSVAHAMADEALYELTRYNTNVNIERYKENPDMADGNCSGILVIAETDTGCILGGSALGKRDEKPQVTASRAAAEIIRSFTDGACVDEHGQDQIIILMALADGVSRIKVGTLTMHTKTAIYIAEKLTKAKFKIIPEGCCSIIECYGYAQRQHFPDKFIRNLKRNIEAVCSTSDRHPQWHFPPNMYCNDYMPSTSQESDNLYELYDDPSTSSSIIEPLPKRTRNADEMQNTLVETLRVFQQCIYKNQEEINEDDKFGKTVANLLGEFPTEYKLLIKTTIIKYLSEQLQQYYALKT